MKNFLIVFLAILLFPSCQIFYDVAHESKEPVSFLTEDIKVIAGAGKSGIGGSESGESWEDPLGGMAGMETKVYEINEISSLRTGFNFSFQGAGYTEVYSEDDFMYADEEGFSGTVSLLYLNFPLLYNLKIGNGFYAEAGLQPGFLIRARDKFENGDSWDYKDYMKVFELGLPVGLGYEINEHFSVGARAVWGLTNNSDSGSGDKDHNYLVMGTISYNIGHMFKNE